MKLVHLMLATLALTPASPPLLAQDAPARILQLYSYRLMDGPRFRTGYRAHLAWHARHQDPLVWYAWTVEAGPRRGQLIDGTAGATLAGLDARPDLSGDGADFARNVGDSVQPVDVETWALWAAPTTVQTLEERKPSETLDVFLLTVPPGRANQFENAVLRLARHHGGTPTQLTWYRRLRGGGAAGYMILVPRARWADIATNGATLPQLLSFAYGEPAGASDEALGEVTSLATETWGYEPQLSLLPGERSGG